MKSLRISSESGTPMGIAIDSAIMKLDDEAVVLRPLASVVRVQVVNALRGSRRG
jgi:hypothetical protein